MELHHANIHQFWLSWEHLLPYICFHSWPRNSLSQHCKPRYVGLFCKRDDKKIKEEKKATVCKLLQRVIRQTLDSRSVTSIYLHADLTFLPDFSSNCHLITILFNRPFFFQSPISFFLFSNFIRSFRWYLPNYSRSRLNLPLLRPLIQLYFPRELFSKKDEIIKEKNLTWIWKFWWHRQKQVDVKPRFSSHVKLVRRKKKKTLGVSQLKLI